MRTSSVKTASSAKRAAARGGLAGVLALLGLVTAACGTGTPEEDAPAPAAANALLLLPGAVTAVSHRTPLSGAFHKSSAKPVDCRRAKCIALTFDDGPGAHTDRLLSHLARYDARATFFVVGQNVAADPGPVRRAARDGHEIGNHSWSHRNLTTLSAAAVRQDLLRTDRAVRRATGAAPKVFRPPYGAFNGAVRKGSPHPLVLWSVDTFDWRYRNSAQVARKAIRSAKPGGVILFHDIHPTTVAAVPRVLKTLSARGYHFVTVSHLFRGTFPSVAYAAHPRR